MATPPKPFKQARLGGQAPLSAPVVQENPASQQELSASQTGSGSEQLPPQTGSSTDEHTTPSGLVTTGDGVLSATGGDSAPVTDTGASDGGDGSAGLATGSTDGGGDENLEYADNSSQLPTIPSLHWPVVYRTADGLAGMTYTGDVPEDAEVVAEVTADYSVQEVIELMRAHGFSAKSALNHMVDCGYQFQSEDDSNMFASLDY